MTGQPCIAGPVYAVTAAGTTFASMCVGTLNPQQPRGELVASLSLRHSPASAAIARRSVASAFQKAGLTADQAFDAALIASELVGNAIRHGLPLPSGRDHHPVDAGGRRLLPRGDRRRERGRVTPQPVEPHSTNGRGLMIVAALSRDWGVFQEGNATTVWTRAPLSPRAMPSSGAGVG